ncbi:MAG: short-chain dehydrogenase/reductase [Chthonomonadaceae bacterium]|nr:short-chain dehydrogenase/reductase [Chthonomonadaceae bacterium]
MLLENKNAIIYGAGGAIGGAVARAFAREGARVFLTGRTLAGVEAVAREIIAEGGTAEAAEVDALNEQAVERHLDAVVEKAGGIDISFNAIGIPAGDVAQQGLQGVPLAELSVESFALPIATYTRAHFLTGRAAAKRMVAQKRSGVILMHTPEPARIGVPLIGGMGPAWAAMEAISRSFSAEFASYGVRTVCLRSTGLPETATIDVVFDIHARAMGITREDFQKMLEGKSHTRRSTTLKELTDAAVVMASDLARGMTGTVANLTGGLVSD